MRERKASCATSATSARPPMAKFAEIFEDVTKKGTKIPSNLYLDAGLYPIIDQGQSEIAGYIDKADGLFIDVPAIIFGDHTRIIKYVDKPCFLGADGVKLLKAKDKNANYRYLYYVLCNANIPDTGYNRHFKWLKEIDIPEYTKEQQRLIASHLDKVTNLISLRKQQLVKLDELVKSRFVEMFGDVLSPSGEFKFVKMADVSTVGSSKRIFQEEYVSEGIPFYRTKEIVELSHGKPLSVELFISRVRYNEIKSRYGVPIKGDLLVSAVGTIGEIWIVDGAREFYFKDGNLMQIRPGEKLDPVYLRHCLRTLIQHFKAMIPSGTAYAALTIDSVKKMKLPLPPLALQREFAAFVEKVDKLEFKAKASLEKLETLKKAMMQKYFN